jgi:cell fate (sporulation/competence/biofilm development) regulator YlbF (YheA/YmcA/DUF963 family)
MDSKIYDILDDIALEFLNEDIVKEYKELDKIINEKYAKDILAFNTAKEILEEQKKYSSDLSKYTKALSDVKNRLYQYPEVKRYNELYNIISKNLVEISNEIAKSYSNKFKEKKVIK